MNRNALAGIKVLELAEMAAGPYCAKLMADLGAEVIKVERPGGDPARRQGPFLRGLPHPERCGLFLYLNTGKKGITLEPGTPTGRRILGDLVRWADVVVEDRPPAEVKELGLDYASLRQTNPSVIVTSITPFGRAGRHRQYRAYHLNTFHSDGQGYLLPGGTAHLERPPVKSGRFVADYCSGYGAATATLMALFWRNHGGSGQHIDFSKQDWGLGLTAYYQLRYPREGVVTSRATHKFPLLGMLPCQDGYVVIMAVEEHHWKRLVEMLGDPELSQDERFKDQLSRARNGVELNRRVIQWLAKHPKQEVYELGQKHGVPVGMVNTAAEVLRSRQLWARGFFQRLSHPEAGELTYPSAPYRYSATPWGPARPAPLLGEHNEEVYCGLLGRSNEELVRLRGQGVV